MYLMGFAVLRPSPVSSSMTAAPVTEGVLVAGERRRRGGRQQQRRRARLALAPPPEHVGHWGRSGDGPPVIRVLVASRLEAVLVVVEVQQVAALRVRH